MFYVYLLMKNILLIWWWSMWHITPLLNLWKYLHLKKWYSLLRIWKKNSLEEKVAIKNNISFFWTDWIVYKKYNNLPIYKKLLFFLKKILFFLKSIFVSYQRIKKNKANYMIFAWWHIWFWFVISWILHHIPLIILESNKVEWLANRFIKRWSYKQLSLCNLDWYIDISPLLPLEFIKHKESWFWNKKTTIVVTWWSVCWEEFANKFLDFSSKNKDLIRNFKVYILACNTLSKKKVKLAKEIDIVLYEKMCDYEEIAKIYYECDISITRWGAYSLQEQHYFNVKKIIFPLSTSKNNHQYYNAKEYLKKNKDIIILNDCFSKLYDILLSLRNYKKQRKEIYNFTQSYEKVSWFFK